MNTIESAGKAYGTDTAKSQRVNTVGWLAGSTAIIALLTLSADASIGVGLAVIGISAMVTVVSYLILRDR